MTTYTINRIQEEVSASGSHWFDRDSMRFFKTRIEPQVYQGPGGIYFVTSEKGPTEIRLYSVRQYRPNGCHVDTVGEFNHLSRSEAHRIAQRLALTDLDAQFTGAMIALDVAMTGSSKAQSQTQYGTVAEAREMSEGLPDPIYLSDGGYTRVLPRRFDDGGGYWLKLIATQEGEDRRDAVEKAWRDAYNLQSEVCRVLGTEPADETLTATDPFKPISPSEQLAMDIQRGGGRASKASAAKLIRLATKHQKMMVDACNGDFKAYDENDQPVPRLAKLQATIEEAAKEHGCSAVFSGDPRGSTVKLILPNKESNSMGNEGWCIPTRET